MTTEDAVAKLRKFFRLNKRLPSYQEMADIFGFASKNASYSVIKKLIEAGYMEKDSKGKLVPKRLFMMLSMYGSIKAGFPAPAEDSIPDVVSFDEYLVDKPDSSYLLKVSGESMIGAGIFPEDIVIVEKGRTPRNGDVVVAFVDNEWTLKHFEKKEGMIRLIPANPKYPVIIPKNSLSIGGVVVSVIRKYV